MGKSFLNLKRPGKGVCWRFFPALVIALLALSFLTAAPAEAG